MLTLAEKRKPEMWDPGTHGGWAGALQVLSTAIILIAVCECKSPAPVCQAMGTKGKNKLHWSSWCQCVPQIIHSNIFSSKRGDKENQNFCVVEKSLCTIQMSNGTGCCVLVLLKPPSCPHWATLLHFGSFNNSFFYLPHSVVNGVCTRKSALWSSKQFYSTVLINTQGESLYLKGTEREK